MPDSHKNRLLFGILGSKHLFETITTLSFKSALIFIGVYIPCMHTLSECMYNVFSVAGER